MTSPEHRSDASFRDCWSFGHDAEAILSRWRAEAEARPAVYVASFSVFWLLWTIGYMVALQWGGSVNAPIHSSPHIAFSGVVTGALLFPKHNWWLPMAIFTALFAASLFGPEMRYFLSNETGMTLGAVSFALNLGLGLAISYGAPQLGGVLARKSGRFCPDIVTLGLIIPALPVVAVLIHLGEWGVVRLSAPEALLRWEGFGYSSESLWHVLHRGVRGAMVTLVVVLLFVRPVTWAEAKMLPFLVPLLGVVVWIGTEFEAVYAELAVTTLVLAGAFLIPVSVMAVVIILFIWPLALWTGLFVLPYQTPDPLAGVIEGNASVIVALIAVVMLMRLQIEVSECRREAHLLTLNRLIELAQGGSFAIDRKTGDVWLDGPACKFTGLAEKTELGTFLSLFDDDSAARFVKTVFDRSLQRALIYLHSVEVKGRAPADFRIYLISGEAREKPSFVYGVAVNITPVEHGKTPDQALDSAAGDTAG
jgi:hypothetical protein